MGAVIGWIFLGMLGLALLALLLPVSVSARYENGTLRVWARLFLLVKYPLYPAKPKKPVAAKKTKRKKKEEPEEEKPEKPQKQRGADYWLRMVERVAASAKKPLRIIMKGIFVRGVELVLPVCAEEADKTATYYGRMQALVGGARAALENLVNVRFKRVVVIPDFAHQYEGATLVAARVTSLPVVFLAAGACGLWKFFTWRRPFWRRRTTPLHTFGNSGPADPAFTQPTYLTSTNKGE